MRKVITILSVVLVFLLLAAQCAISKTKTAVESVEVVVTVEVGKEGPISIGYAAPGLDAGQVAIMDGLVSQAEERGWGIITANANNNSQVQGEQIDYFLSLGVEAIVVVPVDSQAICESVKKSQEAEVLFYTIDRAPVGCEINMTVLADNYLAGVQAGEAMIELLTERYGRPRGAVLELQGDLNTNVAMLRRDGFHFAIDQYSDIKVISKPTGWQADGFASATREVMAATDIDGIYVHADGIAIPVILPILEEFGKKITRGEEGHIFITGVGGSPPGLQAIRDGYADQTSGLPLFDFGVITGWIQKELDGEEIKAGEVVEEGALWSPATVEKGKTGWQLLLSTTSVTSKNVDEPTLWGNQVNH